MKVLLISLFHPELVRGGAQQICYELFEGLRERNGVEPTLLASIDSSLPSLFKSGARITGFDGRESEYLFLSQQYDYWWHKTTHSQLIEAYVEFLQLIKPDVIHFHHFLTFGIDFFTITRKTLPTAKIIFTLHEFLTICAADGQMLRRSDHSLCDHASPVRCHQCFPSVPPEQFFIRKIWMSRHLDVVDLFTTPSRFMIEHFVSWVIDRKKIRHVTNGQKNYESTASSTPQTKNALRNRFGFFGQLVDNKGVSVILEAVRLLRAKGFSDFRIEINGDNLRYASQEKRAEIEAFLANEETLPEGRRNVYFNGSYQVDQLGGRMARNDWCIVPSVWWEIFGLVISEAWMFKKPVIASNVGGPAERISHDTDGLLFQVGDPNALADTIMRACTEKGIWQRLSLGIRGAPGRDEMVDRFVGTYVELLDRTSADDRSLATAAPNVFPRSANDSR